MICDRCESPIDRERPGTTLPSGKAIHNACPEFEGQMVAIGGFAEAFEVDGVPRIVYADAAEFTATNDVERQDLQDAVEDHYERRISWGSWRQHPASWVVPSPTEFDGSVWVCRTDGWAHDDGLEE